MSDVWHHSRRRVVCGLALAPLLPLIDACSHRPPESDGDFTRHRVPAEFEPTTALWLGYDPGHADLTVAMVAALQPHVALKLLVQSQAAAAQARQALVQRGLRLDGMAFLVEPQAIFFTRDAAVFAVDPQGAGAGLTVIDFQWSQYGLAGWCDARHAGDSDRARFCAADSGADREGLCRAMARLAGAGTLASTLTLEGGGLEFNGQGLILVSQPYLSQRNPGQSRDALERELLKLPGQRKVVWLAEGLAEDPQLRATLVGDYVAWGTGGHTDEFVRFADARTVLLAWPDDADAAAHPVARLNRQRMQRNLDILLRASDADGQPLRVVKLPMPRIIERRVFLSASADGARSEQWSADYFPAAERRWQGQRVTQVASASYLNFIIANGLVLVPDYLPHGTPRALQQRVRAIFEQVFGGRTVRFIDALGFNWVGGGPHCATLNEPRAWA